MHLHVIMRQRERGNVTHILAAGHPSPPSWVAPFRHKNETSDDANSIETADTVNHMVYALILTLREREGEREGGREEERGRDKDKYGCV